MCVFVFSEQDGALESFTVEKILSGVFLMRCHDYVELLAELHLLPDFLRKHPQVCSFSHLREDVREGYAPTPTEF